MVGIRRNAAAALVMRFARLLLSAFVVFAVLGCARDRTTWSFDKSGQISADGIHVEGTPKAIETAAGSALHFDGVHDAIFISAHPLAGVSTFTAQAVFRPDGGAFEQRWLHLAEVDPKTGADTGNRFLFEIRVVGDRWYLDAFTTGVGYKQTLAMPQKTFPVGRWYAVAMTYDGTMFRSYVDGVLQGEAPIAFRPQGEGRASLGARINRVNYFHGDILEVQFLGRALLPQALLKVPASLNAADKQG